MSMDQWITFIVGSTVIIGIALIPFLVDCWDKYQCERKGLFLAWEEKSERERKLRDLH